MRATLPCALLLSLLTTVACDKNRGSKAPEPEQTRAGYGELAWTESGASPSIQPMEVCRHLARLVAAETGNNPDDVDPQLLAECESDLAVEASVRGTDSWNAIAGCVLRARTGADIDVCDRENPMPNGAGPIPEPTPEVEVRQPEIDACTHMIAVMIAEDEVANGEPTALSEDDKREVVEFCAQTLAAERPTRDPAAHDRKVECIATAQSQIELQACDSL